MTIDERKDKCKNCYCEIMEIDAILFKLVAMNTGERMDELNRLAKIPYSYKEWQRLFDKTEYGYAKNCNPLLAELIYSKLNSQLLKEMEFVLEQRIPAFDSWREK